jgi:transcriptional regulator with XRE-family HTH domain
MADVGYGGKLEEQRRARELRAQSWTLQDIATELGVSKSSVSLWVRDVDFVPNPRRRSHWTRTNPHPMHVAKLEEIERCNREGAARIGVLSEREFLVLGAALYAGEGAKTQDALAFANSDPLLIRIFVTWLRRFFDVEESKFRVRLYLHEGLDLDAAIAFWSDLTHIPPAQFYKPYRAPADSTIRRTKHLMGCPKVSYLSTSMARSVMGLVAAVSSLAAIPG